MVPKLNQSLVTVNASSGNLSAEVLLYSNYEKTLSFLIQLNVEIEKISSKGVELKFESHQRSDCLQIISTKKNIVNP